MGSTLTTIAVGAAMAEVGVLMLLFTWACGVGMLDAWRGGRWGRAEVRAFTPANDQNDDLAEHEAGDSSLGLPLMLSKTSLHRVAVMHYPTAPTFHGKREQYRW